MPEVAGDGMKGCTLLVVVHRKPFPFFRNFHSKIITDHLGVWDYFWTEIPPTKNLKREGMKGNTLYKCIPSALTKTIFIKFHSQIIRIFI